MPSAAAVRKSLMEARCKNAIGRASRAACSPDVKLGVRPAVGSPPVRGAVAALLPNEVDGKEADVATVVRVGAAAAAAVDNAEGTRGVVSLHGIGAGHGE